jgi:hypothetical protein
VLSPKTDEFSRKEGLRVRKAIGHSSEVPAGYVVAAPWWGTLDRMENTQRKFEGLSYILWNGPAMLSISVSWYATAGGTEDDARQLAADVIRTIKVR